MRTIDQSRVGRDRWLAAIWIIGLAATLLAVAPVAGSSAAPIAVASKKKCKKERWKCAPKRYHLSAGGTYSNPDYSEVWSAEVDLGKRRASFGEVDYAQDGGQVTVSGSGTGLSDVCLFAAGDSTTTYRVPQQKLQVPRGGINDADFGLTFKLIGSDKNTYGLSVGAVQPELSNIKGTVIATCSDGTSHALEYAYINSIQTVMALVRRGKVGGGPLTGSAQGAGESLTWKLTKGK
jgi:hypothetical protein